MKNIRWEIRNTVERIFSINAQQVRCKYYNINNISKFHKTLINCRETVHGISK